MGDWPLSLDGQIVTAAGPSLTACEGVALAGGAANVKGSYSQLIASTPSPAYGIIVTILNQTAGVAYQYLIDIAIGSAGNEVVVVPNLLLDSYGGSSRADSTFYFPIYIPAGVRVSARCQCSTTSSSATIAVYLLSGGFIPGSPYNGVIDIGTNTSTSQGTAVDPGTTANTKGSYAQLVASLSNTIRGLVIVVGDNAQGRATHTYGGYLIDVAIGGAGSELVIIPNWTLYNIYDNGVLCPKASPIFPIQINAGTRIAVRAAAAMQITNTLRIIKVALYGVY